MNAIIKINMDNEAFQGDPNKELANILHRLIMKLDELDICYFESLNLYDTNGNNVGKIEVQP